MKTNRFFLIVVVSRHARAVIGSPDPITMWTDGLKVHDLMTVHAASGDVAGRKIIAG